MSKLHDFGVSVSGGRNYVFHCPGCRNGHPVDVPRWTWNGSMDKPTFSPSLLCNGHDPASRCHSFIKDGQIQFLADCHHALAGQTVEIPDWDDEESVTPARAIADDRRAILREIDRRAADPANRRCFGFVALQEFKLWLLARAEKEEEGGE